jgi:recombination protein RecR
MRSTLPKAVRDLTQELTRLPGIGPKTAQRMAIYLLRQPHTVVGRLAQTLKDLHANVRICQRCFNLAESEICSICREPTRNQRVVCVVEDALDIDALERTNSFDGLYHVLGGVLSPLTGIGPEQLTLEELFKRLEREVIEELIIALDPTMEGEATTRHITNRVSDKGVTVTRLARGLPTGGDIEFADAMTLSAALSGRKKL